MNRDEVINLLRVQKQELKDEFGVVRIALFGSYARGDAREDSDIDVVVELTKPDLFSLIGLKQVIEERTGKRVEIVRMRGGMNDRLRKRIMRDIVYV